jgi:TolA-binding protein
MKKQILLYSLVLLSTAALANEPSAFGNGNSNDTAIQAPTSNSTYSITSSDVVAPKNSQKIEKNSTPAIRSESSNNGSSSEQYDILRSIMESYEAKIAKQDDRLRQLEEENKKLQTYVEESRSIQNDNQEKIKAVLGELGSLIDSINKDYVPKSKFDQLYNEVHGNKSAKTSATTSEPAKKDTPKEKTPSAKELSGKDSATLLKEADALYDKKSYSDAEVYYKELLNRNYKPAKVNFTLGEIAYSKKSYSSAIEHYKASIALFDKASYIPTLLYHTGSSFEKLGKNKDAQNFYKALKENYPTSPEAKKVK